MKIDSAMTLWRVLLQLYVLSSMGALDTQIGGRHYKGCRYQPVKFCTDLNLNFIQGNIVKYITRYKEKNGLQDLEKVFHYAQLGLELRPLNFVPAVATDLILRYISLNNLTNIVGDIIRGAVFQDWHKVINSVTRIISQEYE